MSRLDCTTTRLWNKIDPKTKNDCIWVNPSSSSAIWTTLIARRRGCEEELRPHYPSCSRCLRQSQSEMALEWGIKVVNKENIYWKSLTFGRKGILSVKSRLHQHIFLIYHYWIIKVWDGGKKNFPDLTSRFWMSSSSTPSTMMTNWNVFVYLSLFLHRWSPRA